MRVTIAALIAAAASGRAIAQPREPGESELEPAKDPKLARKWLAVAQELMQKGGYLAARNRPDDARPQFENAVTAYRRAIEAGADPSVYLDLAGAEDRLGKLDDAVRHLRRVAAAGSGARPDVVKKAGARLEQLLAKVGLVSLIVTPAGASITLGGAELGTAPLHEPLVLMPGTYTVSFHAEGRRPKEAEITVEPGAEIERVIQLDPVNATLDPASGLAPAAPGPAPKLPLYLGAAVTGAAVLNATIFGALAIAQHATFTGASTSRLDREDARTNGKRFALVADVSLGAAAVAAGFTAYWYIFPYRRARPSRQPDDRRARPVETKLEVVPWVQPRSGGAAIAGRF